LKGLILFDVVIAQQMQESVDHEMGKMSFKRDAHFGRLALQRLAGEGDVADEAGERREWLDLRETQHIGGLVDLPPVAVEDALVGIVGEDERDLTDAADPGAGLLQRLENSGFGDGLESVGPVFSLDDGCDFERPTARTQLALSPLAVAPS
jgi:hypothetical protein